MGFFDPDTASVLTRRSSRSKHHSHRSRSRSPKRPSLTAQFFGLADARSHSSRHRSSSRHHSHHHQSGVGSIFGGDGSHYRRNSSRASFFSLPNVSSRSFFGMGRSSYYRRWPRSNFLKRTYKKLKRLLRDLVYYAKRHPLKVFVLVIMPLLTGGALTALLARFGIRMPASLERMAGVSARAMSGDSIGLVGEAVRMAGGLGGSGGHVHLERGREGDYQWEKRRVERDDGWGGGYGGGGGLGSMAKMFF